MSASIKVVGKPDLGGEGRWQGNSFHWTLGPAERQTDRQADGDQNTGFFVGRSQVQGHLKSEATAAKVSQGAEGWLQLSGSLPEGGNLEGNTSLWSRAVGGGAEAFQSGYKVPLPWLPRAIPHRAM